MIENLFKIVAVAGFFASTICAQLTDFPKPPDVVYGTADRCLGSVLPKREFRFALGKTNKFRRELIADNGRVFELSLESGLSDFGDLPVWDFRLVDLTSPKGGRMNFLESYSIGYAGTICPELKPRVIDGNGKPLWCQGRGGPYVKTVRNIRIDDFVVTIAVIDIKWEEYEKDKVSEVEVKLTVEPWRDRADKDKFPHRDCASESYQK